MTLNDSLKMCRICVVEKPVSEFSKNLKHKDKLASRCRGCDSVYQTARRRADGSSPRDKQIRASIRDGRWSDVVAALKRRTFESDSGCWIWQSAFDVHGYGSTSAGDYGCGKTTKVHRLMYRATNGGELLDPSVVVHHTCAVRSCVNPDHLQAVTNRANLAEMRERQSYLARISNLEEALRQLDADHDLLRGT